MSQAGKRPVQRFRSDDDWGQERGQIRPRWQLGLRWRPVDEFNCDLIYGRNLTGEQSNWITVATVFRFKAKGLGDK